LERGKGGSMGVNAEFRRDMQQNLLVLRDQEISVSMFQEKMLEHNQLEGFLPIRVQRMNGERIIYYDLYGIQPLSEVCHVTLPNAAQLTSLVKGILEAIRKVGEYLLKEDDILLSLEYMFVRLPEYQIKLCYYPGYQLSIKKQISQLFETLMSCVDYEDRDAVYLMYSLYMKSKDESCTVLDLEQLLNRENKLESGLQAKARIDTEKRDTVVQEQKGEQQTILNSQTYSSAQFQPQQLSHSSPKEPSVSQEIPLAMSTSVMPPELGIGQNVIPKKNAANEVGAPKANVFRPLISNHREEEKEVWFYPSRCYLIGGLIAISVVLVFGIILKSNILFDPVLKKVEPIKLIAAFCIVALPAFYGIKVVFNPERKVSKFVSVGEYELKEMAATKEAMECEVPKIKQTSRSIGYNTMGREEIKLTKEIGQRENTNQRENINQRENTNQREEASPRVNARLEKISTLEEETRPNNEVLSLPDDKKSVSDNRTMILNGVQASPFAQLISEHPEKADTITLVECPFYIGTVKNQMNYSLSCPVISRYHAKIEKVNGIYYISDLNSTNGTFVNGRRLKAEEPNVLIAGDKVAFANICFIFACPNQKYEI
jgi:hypothetical protein